MQPKIKTLQNGLNGVIPAVTFSGNKRNYLFYTLIFFQFMVIIPVNINPRKRVRFLSLFQAHLSL